MLETLTPDTPSDISSSVQKSRRSYTKELKAQIVSECQQGDRSVAQIAMEHGMNANLVHKWIRQARETQEPQMVPVVTAPSDNAPLPQGGPIELSLGVAIIRFYGRVDELSARALINALR